MCFLDNDSNQNIGDNDPSQNTGDNDRNTDIGNIPILDINEIPIVIAENNDVNAAKDDVSSDTTHSKLLLYIIASTHARTRTHTHTHTHTHTII